MQLLSHQLHQTPYNCKKKNNKGQPIFYVNEFFLMKIGKRKQVNKKGVLSLVTYTVLKAPLPKISLYCYPKKKREREREKRINNPNNN